MVTMEMGESIVGSYLRHVRGCEFVTYNQRTEKQGEIDVIGHPGIGMKDVWFCEVATHIDGLNYGTPSETQAKMLNKISTVQSYARTQFPEAVHHFELWSPKVSESTYADWMHEQERLFASGGFEVKFVSNGEYASRVVELLDKAKVDGRNTGEPAFRFLQILSCMTGNISLSPHRPTSKYEPLTAWLLLRKGPRVVMDLDWVEAIIGSPLPAGARSRRGDWGTANSAGQAVAKAGWRVDALREGALHLERLP